MVAYYEGANEFEALISLQIIPEHILQESDKDSKRWPQILQCWLDLDKLKSVFFESEKRNVFYSDI